MLRRDISVALLAGSNLDFLVPSLTTTLAAKGLAAQVWAAGFNQYKQVALDVSSDLYRCEPSVVILFLDALDIFPSQLSHPHSYTAESLASHVKHAVSELAKLVRLIATRLPLATIYVNTLAFDGMNCFYGLEYNSGVSLRQLTNSYNAELGKICRTIPSLIIVDVESIASWTGLEHWYDTRLWHLGRIRYSREAFLSLSTEYANIIAARLGIARKCLVLDLDNTLWGGIVGEDGVADIQLGYEGIGLAYVEFQNELLNFQQRGVLLALCSKNDLDVALAVIQHHPAMVLRKEHFCAISINWKDKAANIREIAATLNIGLDSIVFIDDNPVERARVRSALPEVLVPEWPDDPSQYTHALLTLMRDAFLKLDITAEDQQRAGMYRAQAEREQLAVSAESLEEFYSSLKMQVTIGCGDERSVKRIAQLTQKTNQFNLTTKCYTEAEIANLLKARGCRIYWLDLADRFGPNGIVGVLILRRGQDAAWIIDTFVLSCRVIGRTVEDVFLGTVVDDIAADGGQYLIGEYVPTPKNAVVKDVYEKLGFSRCQPVEAQTTRWRLDLTQSAVSIPEWFEVNSLLSVRS